MVYEWFRQAGPTAKPRSLFEETIRRPQGGVEYEQVLDRMEIQDGVDLADRLDERERTDDVVNRAACRPDFARLRRLLVTGGSAVGAPRSQPRLSDAG
jgi:hypothetical protein